MFMADEHIINIILAETERNEKLPLYAERIQDNKKPHEGRYCLFCICLRLILRIKRIGLPHAAKLLLVDKTLNTAFIIQQ